MAEYVVAPENAVFPIGDLDFEEGAFVEPLSCVLHGVQKARIRLADHVVILGAGPIGILLLQSAKAKGARNVTVVELEGPDEGAHQVRKQIEAAGPEKFIVSCGSPITGDTPPQQLRDFIQTAKEVRDSFG